MRRLVFLLLASAAGTAAAQTGTPLTVEFQDEAELVVSPTQCDADIPLTWTATVAAGQPICEDLHLWVTARTVCGTQAQAGDVDLGTVSRSELTSGTGGRAVFALSALLSTTSDGGSLCPLNVEQTFLGCGRYTTPSGTGVCGTSENSVTSATAPKLIYDSKPPATPTLESLVPIDNGLVARVSTSNDAVVVRLFVKEASAPDTAYTAATTFNAEAASGRIEGLQNGTAYTVKAVAADRVENLSPESGTLTATPVNSEGFYGNYRRSGGAEEGGCSAVGGGAVLSSLALLALGALIRRKR